MGVAGGAVTPQRSYPSAWRCGVSVLRREGLVGMYRGCLPTLVRTFLGQAACFCAFEGSRRPLLHMLGG